MTPEAAFRSINASCIESSLTKEQFMEAIARAAANDALLKAILGNSIRSYVIPNPGEAAKPMDFLAPGKDLRA